MAESTTTSNVQEWIQEGHAALQAGDTIEARKYFRRATEVEPENIAGWLGLAQTVRPYKDKREYLQHALTIDPTHAEAQEHLADVEAKLAAGDILAPPVAPEVTPATDASADGSVDSAAETEVTLDYCYRHPDRETGLHCVQCGRPICTECVRPAFVGQLCPECAQERRPRNYKVTSGTLAIAAFVTLAFSTVISLLVVFVFPFISIISLLAAVFLGPLTAELILRTLDWATQAKRGREMQITVGVAYGLGAMIWPGLLFLLSATFLLPIPLLLFTGIAIAVLLGRLR